MVRVVRGTGLGLEEVTHHPDTGAALVGVEVPNWREIVAVALDAASALAEVPLIGWDMAAVEGGALIVEPNFTPDFFMTQLADRRGMLDARFNAFLEGCKAAAQQTKRKRRIAAQSPRAASGCDGSAGTWPGRPEADPLATGLSLQAVALGICQPSSAFELGSRCLTQRTFGKRKKLEAAGASAPGGLQTGNEAAYADFIVVVTVLKVALICEPSPRAAAMMPTAIRAAMRPYSMAVAPDSSFTKRSTWFCMTTLPTHSLHEASAVVHPWGTNPVRLNWTQPIFARLCGS